MFIINAVLWLAALPFRVVIWMVSLTLWVITLPFRVLWGLLSFVGIGRLITLGVLAGGGYALWRLVADDEEPAPIAPSLDPVPTAPTTDAPAE